MGDVEQTPRPVALKEAVEAARRFFFELRDGGLLGNQVIKDVVLEEVDRSPEGDWLITLGYRQPGLEDMGNFLASLRPQRSEFFKRFKVNQAGEVLAMHLREPVGG